MRNLGARSFAPAGTLAVGTEPYSVIAADVNGDGSLDVISADAGSGTLTVYPALDGAFIEPREFFVGPQPFDLAAADLDGDARSDLVVAVFGDATVGVLLTGGG